jgi:hypothetical protein
MMRVDRALCTENASKMHRCEEFIFYEYGYMVFGDVLFCVCMSGFVLCEFDFDLSAFDSASN